MTTTQQAQERQMEQRQRTEAKPKREARAASGEHSKRGSATKSGPGRRGKHGKPGSKLGKDRPMRAYKALMAAWASKRVTRAKLRDEHGAYTEVGARDGMGMRRTWLGGISAQRGY